LAAIWKVAVAENEPVSLRTFANIRPHSRQQGPAVLL